MKTSLFVLIATLDFAAAFYPLNSSAQVPIVPGPPNETQGTVVTDQDSLAEDQVESGDRAFMASLDEAIAAYRKALQVQPNNFRAHRNLGIGLFHKKDLEGAILEFREALQLLPEDTFTHRLLADALFNKREMDSAIAEYREVLRLDSQDSHSHLWLAKAYLLKNNYDDAAKEFHEVVRLDPDKAESHWSLAYVLSCKGDLDGAEAENREAIRLDPSDPNGHYFLGQVLYNRKNLNGAVAEYTETLRLNPSYAEAHWALGEVSLARNDLNGASSEYVEALRLRPDFALANLSLGIAYVRLGKTKQAIEELKIAAASESTAARAYRPLASMLAFMHRNDEALDAWRHVAVFSPDDAAVPAGIVSILIDQKEYKKAISELRPAIERFPTNAQLLFLMGKASVRAGDYANGMTAFLSYLGIEPSPYLLIGVSQELAEDNVSIDNAFAFASSAVTQLAASSASIQLDTMTVMDLRNVPLMVLAWDSLGWVEFRRGHFEEAENYLNAAWTISRINGDHLGQLYEKLGNKEKAIHYYSMVLNGEPQPEGTRNRLEALIGDKLRADDAIKDARGDFVKSQIISLPLVNKNQTKAEFFVLLSSGERVPNVKFIGGSEELRSAINAVSTADYGFVFPGNQPTKVVRRGVLTCSETNCQLVLRQPGSVYSLN